MSGLEGYAEMFRSVRDYRFCRVGPGNFTPSPSQIRTGYSRIIRLVPSHEGCRLPLNEGLLPANQLAQISGDDPPPSLQPHYRAFLATTKQSAPLRRLGTFGLAVGAACAFSVAIAGQVLTFRIEAWSSFAPPTRRMPLGRYQDILRADPGGSASPRFRHRLIRFRRFRSGWTERLRRRGGVVAGCGQGICSGAG